MPLTWNTSSAPTLFRGGRGAGQVAENVIPKREVTFRTGVKVLLILSGAAGKKCVDLQARALTRNVGTRFKMEETLGRYMG